MRRILLAMAAAAALATAVPAHARAAAPGDVPTISSSAQVYALQIPDKKIDINISTNRGGGRWYASPVWIAIGAIGGVVVLLLLVLVARGGGGTTIVKE